MGYNFDWSLSIDSEELLDMAARGVVPEELAGEDIPDNIRDAVKYVREYRRQDPVYAFSYSMKGELVRLRGSHYAGSNDSGRDTLKMLEDLFDLLEPLGTERGISIAARILYDGNPEQAWYSHCSPKEKSEEDKYRPQGVCPYSVYLTTDPLVAERIKKMTRDLLQVAVRCPECESKTPAVSASHAEGCNYREVAE